LTTNIQSSRISASTMSICARYEFHCPDLRPCSFTSYPKMPIYLYNQIVKDQSGALFPATLFPSGKAEFSRRLDPCQRSPEQFRKFFFVCPSDRR